MSEPAIDPEVEAMRHVSDADKTALQRAKVALQKEIRQAQIIEETAKQVERANEITRG